MAKPYRHAESSVRRYGGVPEDYIKIHNFMDSSKGAIADNRHRALTHNSWFLSTVIEQVFGVTLTNSDGRIIPTRSIAEDHVLEDYGGFIPSAQDFLQEIEFKPWMQNGGKNRPESMKKLYKEKEKSTRTIKFNSSNTIVSDVVTTNSENAEKSKEEKENV